MARYKLNEAELTAALSELPGWAVQDGKLHKEFKFASFAAAMGWMMTVAIAADKLDHHPEWCNVYNRVRVDLATHDLGNVISNLDVALARKMDAAARSAVA
jgi:4a-hydroxytetrahydrobiopterin dehydratase